MDTRFWDDSYVAQLSPNEKLLFLYLLTNPLTNIAGVYEIAVKRIVLDTGFTAKEVSSRLDRMEADGKIVRRGTWLGIVNFTRYQTLNPSVRQGIAENLRLAPAEIVERLRLPPGGQALFPASHSLGTGSDRLSDLTKAKRNLNLNGAAGGGTGLNRTDPMRGSRSGGTSLSEWLRRRRWPEEDGKNGGREPGAGDGGEDE